MKTYGKNGIFVGKHSCGAYSAHKGENRNQSQRTKILKGGVGIGYKMEKY